MKWRSLLPLLIAGALEALPVGNTYAPNLLHRGFIFSRESWIDFRIGYEGDFVLDERLKQVEEGSGRVDDFEQFTNAGTFTLNFLERLDLYGAFGSSRVVSDWRFTTGGVLQRAEVETGYDFLWAAGGRAILVEWGHLALGLEGRYSRATLDPVWLTINGVAESASGSELKWYAWQTGLDMSLKVEFFIPYIGVNYFSERSRFRGFSTPISNAGVGHLHMENRTPVGLFIGCALSKEEYFFLNVEGRFISEEAITISGDLRF